jgi:hypothetical protein
MANVMVTPETWHGKSQRQLQALAPSSCTLPTTLWRRLSSVGTSLLALVTAYTTRSPRQHWWMPAGRRPLTPVDILAQHHTYLYIKSMSG